MENSDGVISDDITVAERALASIFRAAWLGRAEAVRAGLWG